MEEFLFEDPADREDVPGLAHLWVRLSGIYERAIVSASPKRSLCSVSVLSA